MVLFRGLADDLPLDRWLRERIWPAEAHGRAGARSRRDAARVAEMLTGGITCFSDMYYYPDITGAVAAEAGMRAVLGMIALDFPTAWAKNADEYLRKGLEVHDRFKAEPLITTAFAPHAPYSVGDATLAHIRRLADELDFPCTCTCTRPRRGCQGSRSDGSAAHSTARRVGSRDAGVDRRARDGALARRDRAAGHGRLERRALPALEPQARERRLPRGETAARTGVNVALGTDGAASNNRLDLWSEMQTGRCSRNKPQAAQLRLPAAEALRMATIDGARALGLAGEIGSLATGKAADVICVDLSGVEHRPLLDPVSQLVYAASRHDVTDVWVAGEHLVADRAALRLDVAEICAAAERWGQRLRA